MMQLYVMSVQMVIQEQNVKYNALEIVLPAIRMMKPNVISVNLDMRKEIQMLVMSYVVF